MIMKDQIEVILSEGVLHTNLDLSARLGTTEATVRARISDLRKEGANLVKAKIRDFTTRSAWMAV
jgi:biotin operon repressor